MRMVIVGGTGFIGGRLCRVCREQGIDVTVLTRRPERAAAALGSIATIIPWDPVQGPPPAEALEGCDAVVNLAGSSVACRWTKAARRLIHNSRVTTTELVVSRFGQLDKLPHALLNASAAGYYGDRGDELLTERSQAGSGFLAGVCCGWEAAAEVAKRIGVRVVPLRFGIVLGRGSEYLKRALPVFRRGLGAVIGSGKQWMPWVHVADAVGLILHAAREASVEGPLNAVAPQAVTNAEFSNALGQALGRRVRLRVPSWVLRLRFGQMASLMLASQRVAPEVAVRTGYGFQFPELVDCLEDVLARE